MHVLMVSDRVESGEVWTFALQRQGMTVFQAPLYKTGWHDLADHDFDLALLDVYALGEEALALCRALRARSTRPILLLAPVADEGFALEVYRAGVDECIVKPISPALLEVKVAAWLRRERTASPNGNGHVAGLRLDATRRAVVLDSGASVHLTGLEYALLRFMMSRSGQVLAYERLVDELWGYTGEADDTRLKNLVYRLRRKIEADPRTPCHIQTVAGEGYLFQPVAESSAV